MASSDKMNQYKKKLRERMDEVSTVRKIVAVVVTCLILIIAGTAFAGYSYVSSALEPVDPGNETVKSVEIPLGSSSSHIASILEENGIIKDSLVFRLYIKFNNVAEFQAGSYEFSPSMTLNEITDALEKGKLLKEPVVTVTIPEGKTVKEIATLFSEKAGVDKEKFLSRTQDSEYVERLIESYPLILSEEILSLKIRNPLEGYLFAATYQFYEENPSIDAIIEKMLQKTESVVTPHLDSIAQIEINEEPLTVHKALTMASLVEKEARTEEDRKRIAGVFYNRLAENMMLQTDPTVLYALGEHKSRVFYKDLEVKSPYNTYQITGLPVGPISNFGESSLQAVLNPEDTNFMYFVAAPDGKIYYSQTYEEHQKLTQQYLNREATGNE